MCPIPCRKAKVSELEVGLGDVVQLGASDDDGADSDDPVDVSMGLVQAMWQSGSGEDQRQPPPLHLAAIVAYRVVPVVPVVHTS